MHSSDNGGSHPFKYSQTVSSSFEGFHYRRITVVTIITTVIIIVIIWSIKGRACQPTAGHEVHLLPII